MKGTSGNAPLVTGISPHQGTPGIFIAVTIFIYIYSKC
jgi:hypothetical protein